MEVIKTDIEGVVIIEPRIFSDDRGYFYESFSDKEFTEKVCKTVFVQDNQSKSSYGVLRGLHFQSNNPYGKLIAVKSGRILSVAVDLRPESKSFGASYSAELTEDNETMFYIPPYYAHGFMTLEANTEVIFNFAGEHDPKQESGIIYNDDILAIDWQFERYEIDEKYLNMTQRDKKNKSFRMYNQHELWPNRPKRSKYAIRY